MRRLAERARELAAEMRARQPRRGGQVVDGQRFEVARVGQVAGAQQVALGWGERHRHYSRTASISRVTYVDAERPAVLVDRRRHGPEQRIEPLGPQHAVVALGPRLLAIQRSVTNSSRHRHSLTRGSVNRPLARRSIAIRACWVWLPPSIIDAWPSSGASRS